jgi:hypothetical protein
MTPDDNQEAFGPLIIHAGHLRIPTPMSPTESAFFNLVKYAISIANDQWPEKPNDDQRVQAGLFASLFEYGETLWFLIRAKHGTACGTVLRAQVEIVAILAQLFASATSHKDECSVYLDQLQSASNKYALLTKQNKDIQALPIDDLIQAIKTKYPDIKPAKRNFTALTEAVSPRLLQIYKHLCIEAHNNLPAIHHRHLRAKAITAFAPLPSATSERYLRWSAYCHFQPIEWYLLDIGDTDRKNELLRLYDLTVTADPAGY